MNNTLAWDGHHDKQASPPLPSRPPNPCADDEAYDVYFASLDRADEKTDGWFVCANCDEVVQGQAGDTRQCDRCAEMAYEDERDHQAAHGPQMGGM